MIWHDFQFQNFSKCLADHFLQDFLKSGVYTVNQHGTTIFGTPDNVVLTRVDNVVVRFKLSIHVIII